MKIMGKNIILTINRRWRDILIGILLGIVFSCAVYNGSRLIPPILYDDDRGSIWFEADISRVYNNMAFQARGGDYHSRHPLFLLITHPSVHVIKNVFHLEPLPAVRLFIALAAFLWIFFLFMLLRLMGCYCLDGVLFCLLAAVSAASMFMFTVPETFTFGSLSILLALLLVVLSQNRTLSPLWYIFLNIATLSFVVTNWMAGIVATIASCSFRHALRIIAYSLCLLILLSGIQDYIYPGLGFPIDIWREIPSVIFQKGLLCKIQSFFYHTLVMPAIQVTHRYWYKEWPLMITECSSPGSASFWGMGAAVLWTVLVMLGLRALFTLRGHSRFRIVLGVILLGQLCLHLICGDETFLCSLHFIVLLIPLTALSCLTRFRTAVIPTMFLLIPCVAINNVVQFNKALDFFQFHGTERDQVRNQMHFRPRDPWPRGEGHVVLAYPGTEEVNKAYHEPGGSFSPSVGSFGVSIWIVDQQKKLLATSDNIPLDHIQQKFVDIQNQPIPGIQTETDYYEAVWSAVRPGRWLLNLKKKQTSKDVQLILVIRSAGPAGGPVKSLLWDKNKLSVNDRWIVTANPMPRHVDLGDEREKGWITASSGISQWAGNLGWGYAKFELSAEDAWSLTIDDPSFDPDIPLKYADARSYLELSLPDQRFVDCLNAQIAHLMMGTVGLETRPGDPVSYLFSSQSDAAYIIAALARAGQWDAAKKLSEYLAENDFSGGFGPDADMPGLALWAMEEVAGHIQQTEYDKFLWPHIRRKAEIIEKMLSASHKWPAFERMLLNNERGMETVYRLIDGRLVPAHIATSYGVREVNLAAKPAKNGLIIGKASDQLSILYVNAVSYQGLLQAVSLADRLGQNEFASRWRTKASGLRDAWQRAFMLLDKNSENFIMMVATERGEDQSLKSNINNPQTYATGLWPSGVAAPSTNLFFQDLKDRWEIAHNGQGNFRESPLKTYLKVAEAHQWLFLDDSQHVWQTLLWFWKNQASPGLYSWWEGADIRDVSQKWRKVRGWVNPSYVTPHYLTAAEILMLQLDMLVYLDQGSVEPAIVIGAGIPQGWLSHPLEVKGLSLPQRTVDWKWDGQVMYVVIHGEGARVRLGPAFPKETPLRVSP